MPETKLTYHGDRRKPTAPQPDAHATLEPYQPDPELVQAVNLAIYLERPLLLEGEAGCGKSRLAYSVAYELGLPLHVWSVRSTSRAREGLYEYDAILRLHDVQIWKGGDQKTQKDPSNPTDYREFGPLGKAFKREDSPAVVLIDEIDKADLDFPNDLLSVLEPPRHFDIPETGETGKDKGVTATKPPIVIITSNKEKGNLPPPFLRRCVYYFIRFPEKPDQIEKIIDLHLKQILGRKRTKKNERLLIRKAVELFLKIRKSGITKLPSTSELLDWIRVLLDFEGGPFPVENLPDEVTTELPFLEVLYKLRTDWARLVESR